MRMAEVHAHIEYEYPILKSGVQGKRPVAKFYEYCEVHTCEWCGVFGSGMRIQYRPNTYRWEKIGKTQYRIAMTLCMPCHNRINPINRRWEVIDELRLLIGRLQRARPIQQEVACQQK